MQSLTNLCLNKIEDSGADLRELSEIGLPKTMWNRHPNIRIVGKDRYRYRDIYDHAERDIEIDIMTIIKVTYTGVYTINYNTYIDKIYSFSENNMAEKRRIAYEYLGLEGPVKLEKSFESLKGELTPEQIIWLKTDNVINYQWELSDDPVTFAKDNIVATKIGYLLFLHTMTAKLLRQKNIRTNLSVQMSLNGASSIQFPTWELDFNTRSNMWVDQIGRQIRDAVVFIAMHVKV